MYVSVDLFSVISSLSGHCTRWNFIGTKSIIQITYRVCNGCLREGTVIQKKAYLVIKRDFIKGDNITSSQVICRSSSAIHLSQFKTRFDFCDLSQCGTQKSNRKQQFHLKVEVDQSETSVAGVCGHEPLTFTLKGSGLFLPAAIIILLRLHFRPL